MLESCAALTDAAVRAEPALRQMSVQQDSASARHSATEKTVEMMAAVAFVVSAAHRKCVIREHAPKPAPLIVVVKIAGLMAVVANVVLVKHRTSVFPESVSAYLTVLGRCAVPMGAEECAVIVGQKKSAWKEPAKR